MCNDNNLKWKPEEFGNIQTLRILINAFVQHNGDIQYVPPVLFKSICSFNMAAFPFVRKYICNYLAYLLLMKRSGHDLSWRGIRCQWTSSKQESNN
ncbi:unnamed protein product, partial [Rotaria sp. Silwood1]